MAFACTSVQGVLVGSPGGSWDVHVQNRGRAEVWDGQGSEAEHDQELVKRTWEPVETSLRS